MRIIFIGTARFRTERKILIKYNLRMFTAFTGCKHGRRPVYRRNDGAVHFIRFIFFLILNNIKIILLNYITVELQLQRRNNKLFVVGPAAREKYFDQGFTR